MATALRFSEFDLHVKPPARRPIVTVSRLINLTVFGAAALLLAFGVLAG
jgi:hypothetical protein